MKKIILAVFICMNTVTFSLKADEPVCHHCEDIREYNAKYHENFEYYDDYLKAHKEPTKQPTKQK